MSAPKFPVVLTKRAREDYRQVLLYTVQTWGEEQQLAYDSSLLRALALIGDNPHIGRIRDDVPPGYRAYPVEQHVIFYRVLPRLVRVSRILHRRMNAGRALQSRR
jgi:toxin ParE1/3/4